MHHHETVRRIRLKLWRQSNWLLHHDNTPSHASFFTREFLAETKKIVVPQLTYFSLMAQLQMKLKGYHFYTI
jgi:hypothetical protein